MLHRDVAVLEARQVLREGGLKGFLRGKGDETANDVASLVIVHQPHVAHDGAAFTEELAHLGGRAFRWEVFDVAGGGRWPLIFVVIAVVVVVVFVLGK